MGKVSVVVVTYRRLLNLERILQAWLAQTSDVWLCDCGLDFKTNLPVKIARFHPDPGSKTRHAVALLTDGDYVIKADDDALPKDGLIEDFLKAWDITGKAILGLHGRKFHGGSYYRNTSALAASRLNNLQRVDFVGRVTFTSREFLSFDLMGCLSPTEDLFWQMKAFPEIPKWVIPTKRYINLPEGNDKGALFLNKEARKIREEFYREYYLKNYSKEQK